MIRMSLAALFVTCGSFVALAADPAVAPKADAAAAAALESAGLSLAAQSQQARLMLIAQGYTNVSDLQRDEDGRWTGAATKDGTTTRVSVALPPKPAAPAKTN